MRAYWTALRTSLWFVPSVMVLGAVALAAALIRFDAVAGQWQPLGRAGLLVTSADGSRAMLSTIAGSMMTVAGVVFSITIVTLSLASSQYSPRVLRGFMKNGTNQTVLGVFVGIFAYCLVVLGAIRSDVVTFVPSTAVLGGLALALVGIGFLIRFIHHTALSIQASHIVAGVTAETLVVVDRLYRPGGTRHADGGAAGAVRGDGTGTRGRDDAAPARAPTDADAEPAVGWQPVRAQACGYVQRVELDDLLAAAAEADVVIRVHRRVGEFVGEGSPLAWIAPPGGEQFCARVRGAFAIDVQRSVDQDPAWGIRQITDVALKALSPGINDPTTAMTCIDYLTAVLGRLGRCRFPPSRRHCNGALRLVVAEHGLDDFVALAFEQIRASAAGKAAVLEHLLVAIERLAVDAAMPPEARLDVQLAATRESVERTVEDPAVRERLRALAHAVERRVATAAGRTR